MTITIGIEAKDKKLEVAKGDADDRSRLLIDSCVKIGIEKNDISASTLQVSPDYEHRDGNTRLSGSRVYRQVDIILKDLDNYQRLMEALVLSNISKTIRTDLSVSTANSLTDQALIKALADARLRAEILAKASGKELGTIYSISEFETRREEGYRLSPSRKIVGESNAVLMGRAASQRAGAFEPGLISAVAKVYVVYLLE